MKRIPNAREVAQAIRAVRTTLKGSLKELNKTAGAAMAKGNYELGESLAARGREIQDFDAAVQELAARWKELRRTGATDRPDGEQTTPLWAYYQPILKALCECGGEARRTDLEPIVERLLADSFQSGDRTKMARGQERWQMMIRRARRHLRQEGWIEDHTGVVWRITGEGRRAASARPARS